MSNERNCTRRKICGRFRESDSRAQIGQHRIQRRHGGRRNGWITWSCGHGWLFSCLRRITRALDAAFIRELFIIYAACICITTTTTTTTTTTRCCVFFLFLLSGRLFCLTRVTRLFSRWLVSTRRNFRIVSQWSNTPRESARILKGFTEKIPFFGYRLVLVSLA